MWQGKAYAVMDFKDVYAISLSLHNAREIMADLALEAGYQIFMIYYNYYGNSFESAMEEARREMDHFQIWEYDLV